MVGLVGVEARVQQTGFQVVLARKRRRVGVRAKEHEQAESFQEYERASVLRLARCFKQSNLALPTGGLSNPIVRMGRSPAHVQAGVQVIQYFIHSVEDTNLQILYMFSNT